MATFSDKMVLNLDTGALEGIVGRALKTVVLEESAELEALIPCMRQSAQGTLDALHRAGFAIVRRPR